MWKKLSHGLKMKQEMQIIKRENDLGIIFFFTGATKEAC